MEENKVVINVRCEECGVTISRKYSWSYDLTEEDEEKLTELTKNQHLRLHQKANEADYFKEKLSDIKNAIRSIVDREN